MKLFKTNIISIVLLSMVLWLAPANAFNLRTTFNVLTNGLKSIKENLYTKYLYLKTSIIARRTQPINLKEEALEAEYQNWFKPEIHKIDPIEIEAVAEIQNNGLLSYDDLLFKEGEKEVRSKMYSDILNPCAFLKKDGTLVETNDWKTRLMFYRQIVDHFYYPKITFQCKTL